MWWGVVLLAAFGLTTMFACDSGAPAAIAERVAGMRRAALRPQHTVGVVVRIVVAGALGIAAIVDPLGLIEPLIVVGGVLLVLYAITEIGRLAGASRTGTDTVDAATTEPTARSGIRPATIAVAALAGLVVIAGVVWLARPGRDVDCGRGRHGRGHGV